MDQETLEIDNLQIHLTAADRGDPLLLIHGLGGASTSWAHNLPSLSRHFHVLAPDLPGFGRSGKPERRYTPAFFVDTLTGLLDTLKVDTTHVIGASLGGQVALELALRQPERVDRVVAVGPAGVPPASFQGTDALEAYRGILEAETEEDVVQAWAALHPDGRRPGEPTRSPAEVLSYVQSPGARQAFTSALAESAAARRLGPLLGELDPGALLVWGDKDPLIPLDVCRPEIDGNGHAQLAVFPGCGHSPHVEEPGVFGELVVGFLGDRLHEVGLDGGVVELVGSGR